MTTTTTTETQTTTTRKQLIRDNAIDAACKEHDEAIDKVFCTDTPLYQLDDEIEAARVIRAEAIDAAIADADNNNPNEGPQTMTTHNNPTPTTTTPETTVVESTGETMSVAAAGAVDRLSKAIESTIDEASEVWDGPFGRDEKAKIVNAAIEEIRFVYDNSCLQ